MIARVNRQLGIEKVYISPTRFMVATLNTPLDEFKVSFPRL
jgi:hypothetical protein